MGKGKGTREQCASKMEKELVQKYRALSRPGQSIGMFGRIFSVVQIRKLLKSSEKVNNPEMF